MLAFNSIIYAQDAQEYTDLYGDYLGQTPPGDTPVVFVPGIISKNGPEHSAAIFSPDGKEVYWSAGKIFYMQRIDNRWTVPQSLDLFGDSLHIDDQPFLSLNGKRLYINSEGRKTSKQGISPQEWSRYNNEDIWYVDKQGQSWSKPKSLSSVINTNYLEAQASFNNNESVYFLSYLDGVDGECGIFRAKIQNGKYSSAEALPECINSSAQDWTPYIAPDDSYLIFSSYRDGGLGQGDLYVSFHDVNSDTWSEPVNLGEPVNTNTQERFPAVSPDGKYLFFTRWTSEHNHDIFWVDSKIIDEIGEKQ